MRCSERHATDIDSAIAGAGGGLNSVTPYKRPFSLLDLSISFPLIDEQISTATLIVVALVAPAIIVVLVVALFVPGPATSKSLTRRKLIQRKLWEWHAGWLGLALSLATAFFATQALKNLFGKPRPDMLARCQPDLNNVASYAIGGFGQDISQRWTLVTADICTNTDKSMLDDGFRSWPSGHSSFSWSGLLYLSLFLCAKFGIQIPYLPTDHTVHDSRLSGNPVEAELLPLHKNRDSAELPSSSREHEASTKAFAEAIPDRNRAAAPPVYLVVIAFVPICVAFYICSTRFVEFYHFGFDIISGSLIGILSAYGAFRWYHLPISRGSGWAWGPRSRDRAFGIGVGINNYVGIEGWDSASRSAHARVGSSPA